VAWRGRRSRQPARVVDAAGRNQDAKDPLEARHRVFRQSLMGSMMTSRQSPTCPIACSSAGRSASMLKVRSFSPLRTASSFTTLDRFAPAASRRGTMVSPALSSADKNTTPPTVLCVVGQSGQAAPCPAWIVGIYFAFFGRFPPAFYVMEFSCCSVAPIGDFPQPVEIPGPPRSWPGLFVVVLGFIEQPPIRRPGRRLAGGVRHCRQFIRPKARPSHHSRQ
jgi:hypothetical protein